MRPRGNPIYPVVYFVKEFITAARSVTPMKFRAHKQAHKWKVVARAPACATQCVSVCMCNSPSSQSINLRTAWLSWACMTWFHDSRFSLIFHCALFWLIYWMAYFYSANLGGKDLKFLSLILLILYPLGDFLSFY